VKPYPVRLPESLIDDLEAEAEELEKGTAEHVRQILRGRNSTQEHTQPNTQEYTQRIDELEERIETLEESARHREERISALESRDVPHEDGRESGAQGDDESPTPPPDAHSGDVSASQDTPDAGGFSGGVTQADSEGDSLRAKALEAVEVADIPGRSEETRRARAEALLWAWDYLRAQGREQSSRIANATFDAFDEDRIGYGAQERYRGRGLWQGYLRDELRDLPGVEGPGARGRTWARPGTSRARTGPPWSGAGCAPSASDWFGRPSGSGRRAEDRSSSPSPAPPRPARRAPPDPGGPTTGSLALRPCATVAPQGR